MNFSALPSGDFPDREPFAERTLRLLGNRHAGLILESGVVGRGVDRHRRAGRLQPLLLQRAVDVLESLDQGLESRIPVGRALGENDGFRRQRHLFAERVARDAAVGRRSKGGGGGGVCAKHGAARRSRPASTARRGNRIEASLNPSRSPRTTSRFISCGRPVRLHNYASAHARRLALRQAFAI